MKILMILPRIPIPARDGGAIVMLETVRALHEAGHLVDICAVNTQKHFAEPSVMHDVCSSITAVDVDTAIRPLRMLREMIASSFPTQFGIPTSSSYWLTRFASQRMLDQIELVVRERGPYDVVLCESLFTACYGEALRRRSIIEPHVPIVLHTHNVEARIQDRLSNDLARSLIERWFRRRLADQTRMYENHAIEVFDGVIALSHVDAAAFAMVSPRTPVVTVPPGVREHHPTGVREPASLWFLGSLDWTPNVDGLRWFMRYVWPLIHAEIPEATFHIAGRSTPVEVLAYDDGQNVIVHGEIVDPTEYRESYEVGVVPLLSGSGVRVKIIEALMEHASIVTTSIGCEGIPLVHGAHAMIADDAGAFASACVRLLRDTPLREALREAGHEAVHSVYSWEHCAQQLQQALQHVIAMQPTRR